MLTRCKKCGRYYEGNDPTSRGKNCDTHKYSVNSMCGICRKGGHRTIDCFYKRKIDKHDAKKSYRCKKCGQYYKGDPGKNCDTHNLFVHCKCNICNNVGHLDEDCFGVKPKTYSDPNMQALINYCKEMNNK